MTTTIYQRCITLTNHGSANLTITETEAFLALNGKATPLRSGPHGDDLAKLTALLGEGMAVRAVKAGKEEATID